MTKSTGNSRAFSIDEYINSQPTTEDYAQIGRITLQHTSLEFELETLVWKYMGDLDKGHIATARMGVQDITEVLMTLVEWTEPDDGLAEAIEWGVQCFHALRLKRNSIIHAFNFQADQKTERLFLERRTRSRVFDSFELYEISRKTLEQVVGEQVVLSIYLYRLAEIIDARGPEAIMPNPPLPATQQALPTRPALPVKLIPQEREPVTSNRRKRKHDRELSEKQPIISKQKFRRDKPV